MCNTSALNAWRWPRPGPWFEWWYYKAVLPHSGETFYVAYGVVAGKHDGHAFITLALPERGVHLKKRYPLSAASATRTSVTIAGNTATPDRLRGSVGSVRWDLTIANRWSFAPTNLLARWSRTSSAHWCPAQADAAFTGAVIVDGVELKLTEVPGYQDHNWGSCFPRWWFWIACNHFADHPDLALVAGGGRPVLFGAGELVDLVTAGVQFRGRAIGWGKQHFDLARVDALVGGWRLRCTNSRWRLHVEATAPVNSYHRIDLDQPDGAVFHNHETLKGQLALHLEGRSGLSWRTELCTSSPWGSIEYGLDPRRPIAAVHERWLGEPGPPVLGPFGVL